MAKKVLRDQQTEAGCWCRSCTPECSWGANPSASARFTACLHSRFSGFCASCNRIKVWVTSWDLTFHVRHIYIYIYNMYMCTYTCYAYIYIYVYVYILIDISVRKCPSLCYTSPDGLLQFTNKKVISCYNNITYSFIITEQYNDTVMCSSITIMI